MHIVIAGDYSYEETAIKGGIANAIFSLVEGMKNSDDVNVTVVSATHKRAKSFSLSKNINIVFKRIPNLPQTFNSFLFEAKEIRNEIIRINPDIVHAHNMTGYAIGAIKSGYPTLITCHGDWVAEQLKNGVKSPLKTAIKVFFWKKIYSFIFNYGKFFTSISPYVRELILSYNPRAKIFPINNPLSEQYYESVDLVSQRKSIFWAGRICHLKRLDIAIKVFIMLKNKYKDLVFEIAGEPDDQTKDEFLTIRSFAVKELGDSVVFHGTISRDKMIECYDRAKVFLLTSEQEAAPMVILEAMARGSAVVCSDLPGVSHMIYTGVNGYRVINLLPESFYDKICQVLEDDLLLNKFRKNGIEQAQNYRVERIVKENMEAYKEILFNWKRDSTAVT